MAGVPRIPDFTTVQIYTVNRAEIYLINALFMKSSTFIEAKQGLILKKLNMQISDASWSNKVMFGECIHFYSNKYSRVYDSTERNDAKIYSQKIIISTKKGHRILQKYESAVVFSVVLLVVVAKVVFGMVVVSAVVVGIRQHARFWLEEHKDGSRIPRQVSEFAESQ